MTDWSKLSSSVFSQASDALTEAKQRVSQALSEKDIDPQNIDWSKVSDDVLSRASGALTEARQLVNQAASQRDVDLQNIDWSKFSGGVMSRASDAMTGAKQLVKGLGLTNINWSKLLDDILSHALSASTAINNWSIRHPYKSAGALLLIPLLTDPAMFSTLLQLTGTATVFLCFLPVRLIIWCFGFGSRGVKKDSYASQYQSRHYSGSVPRGSRFSKLQSYGATMPTVTSTLVSLLSYAGAMTILAREWGRVVRLAANW